MNTKTRNLTLTAAFTALIFVVTRFLQFPIPFGYINFGNCIILLCCILLPAHSAIFAGSIGSMLADFMSFPVYALPTLIIKAVMPLTYCIFTKIKAGKKVYHIIIAAVSATIPVIGYTLASFIIYGGVAAAIAQLPGLFVEYLINLLIFALLYTPVNKMKIAVNS